MFGAGGDRDAGKRPEMGAVASRLADRVIVTDDNPRSEDPAAIRREVVAGAPDATEIAGRREAIAAAIDEAGPEDIVLLAGKGHEQGQIVGDRVLPFDDVQVARECAASCLFPFSALSSEVETHSDRRTSLDFARDSGRD